MKGKRAALVKQRTLREQVHTCGGCGGRLYPKQSCVTCTVRSVADYDAALVFTAARGWHLAPSSDLADRMGA